MNEIDQEIYETVRWNIQCALSDPLTEEDYREKDRRNEEEWMLGKAREIASAMGIDELPMEVEDICWDYSYGDYTEEEAVRDISECLKNAKEEQ